ncbi:MAG: LysR family transcriptional regulator [Pseudomonadota bacterium]
MQKIDWNRIDGWSLQVLRSVVRTGSMAAAAQHLGINQSTVSHTVDKLRAALNDPLFLRSGRNIEPSEFLLVAMPRIDDILARLEALQKPEIFRPGLAPIDVTIVANVNELLPKLVGLRDRLFDVANVGRLRMLELGSRDTISERLEAREVDLAISVRLLKLPMTLASAPVYQDQMLVFYDPKVRDAPKTLEEFADAKHAVLDFGGNFPSTVDSFLARMNLKRYIRLGVPNAQALGEFIIGTDLICTMQASLGDLALAKLASSPPPFHLEPVRFDLLWHWRNTDNPKNKWLRGVVKDHFRSATVTRS